MSIEPRSLFVIVFGSTLFLVLPAIGQKVSERTLQGNPYRQLGGSCVYGKDGELLFAPKIARCATRHDAAPANAVRDADERFASLPPKLRAEANALIESHAHAAEDIADLRRAVAQDDKIRALDLSDELVKELVAHLAREQAFFENLAKERPPR